MSANAIRSAFQVDVPPFARYVPPKRAMAPFRRETVKVYPIGPTDLGAPKEGNTLRFKLPNMGYLRPGHTSFGFRLHNTATWNAAGETMGFGFPAVGAAALIRSIRVITAGMVAEDIQFYPVVHRLHQLANTSKWSETVGAITEGLGSYTSVHGTNHYIGPGLTVTSGALANLPAGATFPSASTLHGTFSHTPNRRTMEVNIRPFAMYATGPNSPLGATGGIEYMFSLQSGLFGDAASDVLPLWAMGDIEIEIQLNSLEKVFMATNDGQNHNYICTGFNSVSGLEDDVSSDAAAKQALISQCTTHIGAGFVPSMGKVAASDSAANLALGISTIGYAVPRAATFTADEPLAANWKMDKIHMQCEIFYLPDAYTAELQSLLASGKQIKLGFDTVTVISNNVPTATTYLNFSIPVQLSDVRDIQNVFSPQGFSETCFVGAGATAAGANNFRNAQLQIGSDLYPNVPIEGPYDAYRHFLTSFGLLHTKGDLQLGLHNYVYPDSGFGVGRNNAALKPYALATRLTSAFVEPPSFVLGFDIEKYYAANVLTGVPVEQNVTLAVQVHEALANYVSYTGANLLMVSVVRHGAIFVIGRRGVVVLR